MKPVLDTNVLVRGANLDFKRIYLTQQVLDEVKSQEGLNYLETVEYSVETPGEEEMERVRKKSVEISSPTSETDEELVALTSEIDGVLVTDDKPVQNLALHLEIDYRGFMDRATEEKTVWEIICTGCGKEIEDDRGLSDDVPKCPNCGSQIRRKQSRCS